MIAFFPALYQTSLRYFLLLLFFCSLFTVSRAQDRCGTVQYSQKLKNANHVKESDTQFEQWLQKKISARRQTLGDNGRTETLSFQIPVVVHVIHNGEAVGTGTNISDAQIISQIEVLNNDFQRLNADAVNTPAEFQPVAGSFSMEFILAKQDPNGLPTTGIVREQGTRTAWTINNNDELKSISYWPAEDYMNIWVCNLTDYLGYTQFPVSSLAGLEDASHNRLTDGVVIGHLYFGNADAGSFNLTARYNKGRTVTHEVGHFFGLRHIWGDANNCTGTDYVDDTPNQNGYSSGCPSNPQPACTSGTHKMFQNYMDYTDDACMNLYTKDQVDRMTTIVQSAVRRVTLPTSHGLLAPSPIPNDLAVSSIISPGTSECDLNITPMIRLQNTGSNTITTATVQLLINSNFVETKTFSGNLNPLESGTLTFSQQLRNTGTSTFTFNILSVNGTTDLNTLNNSLSVSTIITLPIAVPFTEAFNVTPTNWTIQNPDQLTTWALHAAPLVDANNKAMYIDNFDYLGHDGEHDILISPSFDLTSASIAYLSFNEAYARKDNSSTDGLKVIVINGCGTDLNTGLEVFSKSGSDLATVPNTMTNFTPKSENDWRTEVVDLSTFIGNSRIRLAFVGINGSGNNLYLDNVSMITNFYNDLEISRVTNPDIVTCPSPTPKLLVKNVGTSNITDFKVQYSVNAGTLSTIPVVGLNLSPGADTLVTLASMTLANGSNTITFSITSPNGGVDINPVNSQKTIKTFVNSSSEIAPIKEDFDHGTEDEWAIVNPASGKKWVTVLTNYDRSVSFNSSTLNDQAWLVSPSLDFSRATGGSLFFDLSSTWNGLTDPSDELQVVASVGCGNLFMDNIFYDSSGAALSTTSSTAPTDLSDWKRKNVDLSSLAGKRDVRIAFVATHLISGASNNLYIDNIEFYVDSHPAIATKQFAIYTKPNDPADFYITFQLDEKQAVGIDVVDIMGRPIVSDVLGNVLNETYPVTLANASTGIYIVRLKTKEQYSATKVFVNK